MNRPMRYFFVSITLILFAGCKSTPKFTDHPVNFNRDYVSVSEPLTLKNHAGRLTLLFTHEQWLQKKYGATEYDRYSHSKPFASWQDNNHISFGDWVLDLTDAKIKPNINIKKHPVSVQAKGGAFVRESSESVVKFKPKPGLSGMLEKNCDGKAKSDVFEVFTKDKSESVFLKRDLLYAGELVTTSDQSVPYGSDSDTESSYCSTTLRTAKCYVSPLRSDMLFDELLEEDEVVIDDIEFKQINCPKEDRYWKKPEFYKPSELSSAAYLSADHSTIISPLRIFDIRNENTVTIKEVKFFTQKKANQNHIQALSSAISPDRSKVFILYGKQAKYEFGFTEVVDRSIDDYYYEILPLKKEIYPHLHDSSSR